jgi:hypothetical protein
MHHQKYESKFVAEHHHLLNWSPRGMNRCPCAISPLPMQLFSDAFVAYGHRLVEYSQPPSQADNLLLDVCRDPTMLRPSRRGWHRWHSGQAGAVDTSTACLQKEITAAYSFSPLNLLDANARGEDLTWLNHQKIIKAQLMQTLCRIIKSSTAVRRGTDEGAAKPLYMLIYCRSSALLSIVHAFDIY